MFYGVSEPLSHFISPRPGVTGTEAQLAQSSLIQTYLHWGVQAWAIYVVIGVALAYAIHRRRRPVSIRWAPEPLLGKRVRGTWGNVIDTLALVGTVFVLFSVLSGVAKGMKWLSSFNLILAAVLLVFILFAGHSEYLLREWVQSIGAYLQNLVGLSFTVSAFQGEAGEQWQAAWTSFYWGWWISWAPFVGIFIARVSKGRTVREFVLGVLVVPTLVGILWFAVLGGSALYQEIQSPGSMLAADGSVDLQGALFQLFQHLPATQVLTIGAIVLIGIFFVTSADSGALVMGMIATGGDAEPKRWIRVFFTLATAVLAVALLLAGGLSALQTAAITIALPFSVVMLLICWATVIAFRRERRVYERAERAQLVDYVGEHYGLDVETGNEQGVRIPRWWRARRHPPA